MNYEEIEPWYGQWITCHLNDGQKISGRMCGYDLNDDEDDDDLGDFGREYLYLDFLDWTEGVYSDTIKSIEPYYGKSPRYYEPDIPGAKVS